MFYLLQDGCGLIWGQTLNLRLSLPRPRRARNSRCIPSSRSFRLPKTMFRLSCRHQEWARESPRFRLEEQPAARGKEAISIYTHLWRLCIYNIYTHLFVYLHTLYTYVYTYIYICYTVTHLYTYVYVCTHTPTLGHSVYVAFDWNDPCSDSVSRSLGCRSRRHDSTETW